MKNAKMYGLRRHKDGSVARSVLAALALVPLLGLGGVPACWAQSATAQAAVAPSQVGDATRGWLELQRSNAAAAPAQPMLGAEAGLAYKRYLASFNSKIPDLYGSLMNQSGGGGGSQSGGSPQN